MAKLTKEEIIASLKEFTLVELNDLIKAIEEEFGVSATVVAASAPAANEAASAAPTEVTVVLKDAGAQKINVIKVIREITGLGLMDAKKAAENTPTNLKENVPVAEAEELKKKLTEAGATVELK